MFVLVPKHIISIAYQYKYPPFNSIRRIAKFGNDWTIVTPDISVENIYQRRNYNQETRTVQVSIIRVCSGNTCIELWKINESLKRFPRTVSRYDFPCPSRKTLGEHNCIRGSRLEEKAFFRIKPSTQRLFGNSYKNQEHQDSNCGRMTWFFFYEKILNNFIQMRRIGVCVAPAICLNHIIGTITNTLLSWRLITVPYMYNIRV